MSSPPSGFPSTFNSYFLIIIAILVVILIAATLLASSRTCRCMTEYLWQCLGSCRINKEPKPTEMLPVCRYRKEQSFSSECSVCLTAFQEGETVRQLPACKHSFHAPCIDMWLYSHSSCPLCRAVVMQALSGYQKTAAVEDIRRQQQQLIESREFSVAMTSLL